MELSEDNEKLLKTKINEFLEKCKTMKKEKDDKILQQYKLKLKKYKKLRKKIYNNNQIIDFLDETEIENIKKQNNILMKKVIKTEFDFVKRNDTRLLKAIGFTRDLHAKGLTEEVCSDKIWLRCASLIDGTVGDDNDYFLILQDEIKKHLGFCNWTHCDKHRYYKDLRYEYNDDNTLFLIEYYYMVNYFKIDFKNILYVLSKKKYTNGYIADGYMDHFFNDYEYLPLYEEIFGKFIQDDYPKWPVHICYSEEGVLISPIPNDESSL